MMSSEQVRQSLCRLACERFHQAANVRSHLDLIKVERMRTGLLPKI